MNNKLARTLAAIVVVGLAASLLLAQWHPFGYPTLTHPARPILVSSQVPDAAKSILDRKCAVCHSDRITGWPLYRLTAPASWLLERDVVVARRYMNLSDWEDYSREDRDETLATISSEVRKGDMPPWQYTLIHPGDRLSPSEAATVQNWVQDERRHLASR